MKVDSRLVQSHAHMQDMCHVLSTATASEEPVVRVFNRKIDPKEHKLEFIGLGESYPEVFLTEREAHCCLFLILGFTSKEAAQKLYLSPRTVEHYISCVKVKLKINRRSGVIRALLSSDYLDNLNAHLDEAVLDGI